MSLIQRYLVPRKVRYCFYDRPFKLKEHLVVPIVKGLRPICLKEHVRKNTLLAISLKEILKDLKRPHAKVLRGLFLSKLKLALYFEDAEPLVYAPVVTHLAKKTRLSEQIIHNKLARSMISWYIGNRPDLMHIDRVKFQKL